MKTIFFLLIFFLSKIPIYTENSLDNLEQDYQETVHSYYQPKEKNTPDLLLGEFLAQYPMYTPASLDLIQVYRETGQPQKAFLIAEQLANTYPEEHTFSTLAFVLAVQARLRDDATRLAPLIPVTAEGLFYQGLLSYQQQNYPQAIQWLTKAIQTNQFMPQASHFLGMSYLGEKNYKKAIENFLLTLKSEPNFLLSLEPLAESYLADNQWRKALSTFERARSNVRENQRISNRIQSLRTQYKSSLDAEKSQKTERKTTAIVPKTTTFSPIASQSVRVGISESMQGVFLKAGSDYTLDFQNQSIKGESGDILYLYKRGAKKEPLVANKIYEIKEGETLNLRYSAQNATTTIFDLIDGAGYFFVRTADRSYRGSMQVIYFKKGLTLVNILPMEEYLYSVVPSEIPPYWPLEALKAQAVAARTYTLVNMGKYTQRGFDLFGSIISHAYTGVGGENPQTTKAVNATANEVLYTQKNKERLLTTYYSANTGGFIDKETSVWNQDYESDHAQRPDKKEAPRPSYLAPADLMQWVKSRPSTYSNWPKMHFGPAFRSILWVNAEDMSYRIGRTKKIGKIKYFEVINRSISGRITQIRAVGTQGSVVISGDAIRNRVGGLRTNLIMMESVLGTDGLPEYFVFFSAGWGHGIGMDQSGAAGMAADGHSYKDILSHYYPFSILSVYRGIPQKRP
ncbi:MAG: SpoIID/LytB domain-containing protein [Spirochaetia bacterium]